MEEDNYRETNLYLNAKKRVNDLRGFYWHLTSYIIVNTFLSLIIIYGLWIEGESIYNFGVIATWVFWGIGLAFHAFYLFGFNGVFTKEWEERKIKEFMEKENRKLNQIRNK